MNGGGSQKKKAIAARFKIHCTKVLMSLFCTYLGVLLINSSIKFQLSSKNLFTKNFEFYPLWLYSSKKGKDDVLIIIEEKW